MTYQYPLNPDWTTEEIITVIQFLTLVEAVYEGGVASEDFRLAYGQFKQIVTSIGEEKQLGKSFEMSSGYSIYQAVKQMRDQLKAHSSLAGLKIHL